MNDIFPSGKINKHIEKRLEGIRKALLAAYDSGSEMSSASKGREREAFVSSFLSQVFSPAYRFGTGDITDSNDARSGQLDVVVESPYWYSLPAHHNGARLYMAEGVAAVIEVKSDLASQWSEILDTMAKVKGLQRRYKSHDLQQWSDAFAFIETAQAGTTPVTPEAAQSRSTIRELKQELDQRISTLKKVRADIPCYAVGFRGWSKAETLKSNVEKVANLDGAIILDPPMGFFRMDDREGGILEGEWMLSMLLDRIVHHITEVAKMEMPQMTNYALGVVPQIFTNPKVAFRRLGWEPE